MQQNPYETPKTNVSSNAFFGGEAELASRWVRLGASIIDGFISALVSLPLFFLLGFTSIDPNESFDIGTQLVQGIVMNVISVALFLLFHGYFLKHHGQTLGKKAFGIRIADLDNQVPDFWPMVLKRYVAFFVIAMVPFLGILLLIDYLFIFREDRRCVHDLFAGTQVIKA